MLGKYIRIILELQTANTIHQIEKNEKELKDKFKASEHFQYLTTRDKGYWWHFAQELIPLDDKVLLPYELLDKLKSDVAQMDIYKLGAEIVKKTE